MIRKANFVCLVLLPLMVVSFLMVHIRISQATSYSGPCPNVIGTVDWCEEGWTATTSFPFLPAIQEFTRDGIRTISKRSALPDVANMLRGG